MNLSLRRYIVTILIACVFTIILQQKVSRLYYRAYISAPRVTYPIAAKAQIVDLSKYYNGSMENIQEGNYAEAVRYIQNVHGKTDSKSTELNGDETKVLSDDKSELRDDKSKELSEDKSKELSAGKSRELSNGESPVLNGAEIVEAVSDDNNNNDVPTVNLENVVEKAIEALKSDDKSPLSDTNIHTVDVVTEVKDEVLLDNFNENETPNNEQNLPVETDDNHANHLQEMLNETRSANDNRPGGPVAKNDNKPGGPVAKLNVSVSGNSEKVRQVKTVKKRLSELEKLVIGKSPNEIDNMYRGMLKCRKLPDVLIIGFEKCGTVTLKSYLGIHPQIYMVNLLTNYKLFNRDSQISVQQYTRNLPCTPNGKLRLEKLATWGTVAKTTAVVPNAKLIAIVKEPVERSMSHYVHRTAKGMESTRYNFDTMIASIMDHDKPISLKSSVLFRQSQYIDRLESWIENYGLSNIHVIDGDNFVKDPAVELQAVEKFLGLKPYITKNNFVYNPVKMFYCLKQDGNEACMTSNKGRPHPEMSSATRTRLQEYYKPYNEQLFNTIGRKFSWIY